MGYFDGLTAGSFKTDAQGRELFFFWGKLGKGRVIPSEAEGEAVRRYLKRYYFCILLGIVPMILVAGEALTTRWMATIVVYLLIGMLALVPLWAQVRHWPLASERLSLREAMTASAKSHGVVSLAILSVVSGLFAVLGGVMMLYGEPIVGALVLAFFGFCLIVFLFMLRARKQP